MIRCTRCGGEVPLADMMVHELEKENARLKIEAIHAKTLHEDSETGWLIEATSAQIAIFVNIGYFTDGRPAWWTGVNETIAGKHNSSWTQDPNEAIRFARKIDAEKYILGLGYSLDNTWIKATEHGWG